MKHLKMENLIKRIPIELKVRSEFYFYNKIFWTECI